MKSGEDQPRSHSPHADQDPAGSTDHTGASAHDLARELTGDLPCIVCGYNLRSISVLGVCPECATPVRATILARVDPYAGVLRPIRRPRLVAGGLVLWSSAALAAALATWGLRITDAIEVMIMTSIDASRFIMVGFIMIVLSGLGAAVALIQPHTGVTLRRMGLAALAVLTYIPLASLYWQLHAAYDPPRVTPYLDEAFTPDGQRAVLRLLLGLMMLIIVIGLRPNFRLLSARSLVLRMGRVDRQTMLGLAGAIGVAMAGDLLHIIAADMAPRIANAAFLLGVVLIAVGSMLVTVGLLGILIDCVRILPVILRPPISFGQILGKQQKTRRASDAEQS